MLIWCKIRQRCLLCPSARLSGRLGKGAETQRGGGDGRKEIRERKAEMDSIILPEMDYMGSPMLEELRLHQLRFGHGWAGSDLGRV